MSAPARAAIALLFLTFSVSSISAVARAAPVLTGYVFPQGKQIAPGDLDASEVTRINYAFARIENGRLVEGFPTDAANLAGITALRQSRPGLAVLISVGGWTWSDGFSDAALTPKGRAVFVESAVEFLRRYQLDGIDVDWEYPGQAGAGHAFRSEDKQNFTLLLRDLRAAMDQEGRNEHRRLYLTIAAGASSDFLQHTEMRKVQRYVDAVNLMTYDYYSPTDDSITGNHAPLLTDPADPKQVSVDASVRAFEAAGVPAAKIILGIPFYGRIWAEVPDEQHGLFQPGKQPSRGSLPFSELQSVLLGTGFTRYWDNAAQVPFLYNAQTRQFVSYEDPESAAAKSRYALAHKLQGVMFWSFFNDPSGQLLHAITQALYGPVSALNRSGDE
jgi:chitinase